MNDELVWTVVGSEEAYFCVLCQHLTVKEKYRETCSSGKPDKRSKFEPGASRIWMQASSKIYLIVMSYLTTF
jgi:hypothetical protein